MILLRLCCALKMARVTVCSSVPGLKIRVRMEYHYRHQVAHSESDGGQLVGTNNPLLAKTSYFGRPGTHVSSSAVVAGSPTLLTLLLLLLTLLLPMREEREERTELAPALPAVFFLYFFILIFFILFFFCCQLFFYIFYFILFYCQLVMIERYESCCHKGSLDHNDEAHY